MYAEKLREMAKIKRMSAEMLGDVMPASYLPENVAEKMLAGKYRDYLLTPLSVEQNSDAELFLAIADQLDAGQKLDAKQIMRLKELAERLDDYAARQGWELEKFDDDDNLIDEDDEEDTDDPDTIRDNIEEAREEAKLFRAVAEETEDGA